jgi:hypothetical protein
VVDEGASAGGAGASVVIVDAGVGEVVDADWIRTFCNIPVFQNPKITTEIFFANMPMFGECHIGKIPM